MQDTVFAPDMKLGTWQLLPSPAISRHLARCGWDYVIIDMQHGAHSLESAYESIHTLRANGVMPWVRTPVEDLATVSRVLDAGAAVVVAPMVNSAKAARAVAEMAKYPPLGRRSVGGDVWHHLGSGYLGEANDATRLVVQIEHYEGVAALPEITTLLGIDGYFAGPVDLALSWGLPVSGHDSDERHRSAIQAVLEAAERNGKMPCINCDDIEDVRRRARQGFRYLSLQSDVDQLIASGRALVAELRQSAPAETVSIG